MSIFSLLSRDLLVSIVEDFLISTKKKDEKFTKSTSLYELLLFAQGEHDVSKNNEKKLPLTDILISLKKVPMQSKSCVRIKMDALSVIDCAEDLMKKECWNFDRFVEHGLYRSLRKFYRSHGKNELLTIQKEYESYETYEAKKKAAFFPEALFESDTLTIVNHEPCSLAAKYGHLKLLKWFLKIGYEWNCKTIFSASMNGHLNILKWCHRNGCSFHYLWYTKAMTSVLWCIKAITNGHLDVLKWACKTNIYKNTEKLSYYAANFGQYHILEWAISQGFGWGHYGMVSESIARHGNLNILKWARSQGCPWNETTCAAAAESGHFELLKWAHNEGCPWKSTTCSGAARSGHTDILKWAHSKKCPWDVHTCSSLAEFGHYDLLKWARSQGCPWDEQTCRNLARNGDIEMLKWAVDEGCPFSPWTDYVAAGINHLDMLKWSLEKRRELNIPDSFGFDPCVSAASEGHLNILKWIHQESIVTLSISEICETAAHYGQLEVLKWVFSEMKYSSMNEVCYRAAANGQLEVLNWARENNFPWNHDVCTAAASNGHFEVLKWAIQKDCPIIFQTCLRVAKEENHFEVLKFLCFHKQRVVVVVVF